LGNPAFSDKKSGVFYCLQSMTSQGMVKTREETPYEPLAYFDG
jgi:hypothetical protein